VELFAATTHLQWVDFNLVGENVINKNLFSAHVSRIAQSTENSQSTIAQA
jgi:hypothetical protein